MSKSLNVKIGDTLIGVNQPIVERTQSFPKASGTITIYVTKVGHVVNAYVDGTETTFNAWETITVTDDLYKNVFTKTCAPLQLAKNASAITYNGLGIEVYSDGRLVINNWGDISLSSASFTGCLTYVTAE